MSLIGRDSKAGAAIPPWPAPRPQVPMVRPRPLLLDPWVALALLYPLTMLVEFDLVGQLYLIDLLGLPLLGLLLVRPDAQARLRQIAPAVMLLALWLASAIVTDLIRATPPADFLRGWGRTGFFALQILVLWLWLPRRQAYFASFAIGLGIAAIFSVPEEFASFEWKFGYDRAASLVTLGLAYFAVRKAPRLGVAVPLVMIGIALFLLLQSARSAFGIAFVAAVIAALVLVKDRMSGRRGRLGGGALLALVGLAGAAAMGAFSLYGSAVEDGLLGRAALEKYREQTGGEVPLILGGRTESLVSIQAIADSPIIGHGSWARDKRYADMFYAARVRLGLPMENPLAQRSDLIPTHSHLFGAWVEAGLAGGIFWIWVIGTIVMAVLALFRGGRTALAPLACYAATALLWSTLFSPSGATERFFDAFCLVLVMALVIGWRGSLGWRARSVGQRTA